MNSKRVLIVDDHAIFRTGLRSLLEAHPNILIVGEASDGAQGVAMARNLKPDLVLMDIHMDGMDGIAATRQIKSEMPKVCVVVLTESENEQDFVQAIKNGAQGYILKGTRAEQFFCLIEGALAGGMPISGSMAAKLVRELAHPARAQAPQKSMKEPLSKRERQVLECLKDGPTNRQIAAKLLISESTVKKHIHRIFAKLRLQNRSQAAVIAGGASASVDRIEAE